jgi:hypothetical protein
MIKGIMGNSGIVVDGGNTALPYVSQNDSNTFQGIMRIRGSDIQYYDNGNWTNLYTSYATVKLDGATEAAVRWAQRKMAEEAELARLAQEHPAIAKAQKSVERAQRNLQTIKTFVTSEQQSQTSVQ